jgi:3-oxoadipate enol-lactonase
MSHELQKGVKGSKLVELKGCAHVPQLQAPDQFMAAIAGFIAA